MRVLVAVVAAVLLAVAATLYAVREPAASTTRVEPGAVDLTEPGRLVFVDEQSGRVASVALDDPGGPRRVSALACRRFHTAAGQGLCLADAPGPLPSAVAVHVDHTLSERDRVEVAGTPNRARLSPDGRMAAWTTFVTGDSYSQAGTFSTRTAIMDRREDQLSSNIEGIPLGRPRPEDVNYWGVTFAADNRTFYATLSTGGQTFLVRGDQVEWRAQVIRENVECPALSPDGTKIAFKKRVAEDGVRPWRQHVLDLATMVETPLVETRGIDDQVVWLDDHTIAYGLPGEGIWSVPADGSGASRLLVPHASSPSAVEKKVR